MRAHERGSSSPEDTEGLFWRSLIGWSSLWILGSVMLPIPAVALSSTVGALLRFTSLGDLSLFVGLAELAGWWAVILVIGWHWAMTGTRKLLSREAVEVETLDRRTVVLLPSKQDLRRVNLVGVLPLAVAVALIEMSALIGMGDAVAGDSMWFARLIFALIPSVVAVLVARSMRSPSITVTPTSLSLSRPLVPDRTFALAEVRDVQRNSAGDLWIVTDEGRVLAGRLDVEIPQRLREVVRPSDAGQAVVDPALEQLRGRAVRNAAD